jgi:hypothetical protein
LRDIAAANDLNVLLPLEIFLEHPLNEGDSTTDLQHGKQLMFLKQTLINVLGDWVPRTLIN